MAYKLLDSAQQLVHSTAANSSRSCWTKRRSRMACGSPTTRTRHPTGGSPPDLPQAPDPPHLSYLLPPGGPMPLGQSVDTAIRSTASGAVHRPAESRCDSSKDPAVLHVRGTCGRDRRGRLTAFSREVSHHNPTYRSRCACRRQLPRSAISQAHGLPHLAARTRGRRRPT